MVIVRTYSLSSHGRHHTFIILRRISCSSVHLATLLWCNYCEKHRIVFDRYFTVYKKSYMEDSSHFKIFIRKETHGIMQKNNTLNISRKYAQRFQSWTLRVYRYTFFGYFESKRWKEWIQTIFYTTVFVGVSVGGNVGVSVGEKVGVLVGELDGLQLAQHESETSYVLPSRRQ